MEIGAGRIPAVTALNKIDRLSKPEAARNTTRQFSKAVAISARRGTGEDELLEMVKQELYERFVPVSVHLPYQQGALISLFHESGQVDRIEHVRGGVLMEGRIPGRLASQFEDWQIGDEEPPVEDEEEEG